MSVPLTTRTILETEDRHLLNTYKKLPIALATGRGSFVTDVEGTEYLDLYGGHAVALTGHSHPHVVRAIQEQAARLLFYSNAVYLDVRALAAARLARFAPEGMRAFLANSGTEANETALKIARMHTGRPGVVSMEGSFHGRTLASLSATGLPPYREKAGPLVPGSAFVPFGDAEAARRAVGPETAVVILEPIQSMAGVREAAPDYYRELKEICDEAGALLVFDEVQTAPARTGAPFYGAHVGVIPDLISTAKGIASGFPCGVTLASAEVAARVGHGDQGSTFGGGPLACAALAATLEVIEKEELVENAKRLGAILTRELERIEGVSEVGVRDALLARRILVATAPGDENTLRLMPPLVIGPDETDRFTAALREVLAKEGGSGA